MAGFKQNLEKTDFNTMFLKNETKPVFLYIHKYKIKKCED